MISCPQMFLLLLLLLGNFFSAPAQVGVFANSQDIGPVKWAGEAVFHSDSAHYELSGSGANVWGREDAFRFVWRRVSGDAMLTADIEFVGPGKNPHRKAMLMFRQSLDAGAVYVDAALHGDGLTSLQYRDAPAGLTQELRSPVVAPQRLRLVHQGNTVKLFVAARPGDPWTESASLASPLRGAYYVGLGLTSHDNELRERAIFRNVAVEHPPAPPLRSRVMIYDFRTKSSRQLHEEPGLLEAPNWSRDGSYLLVNARGRLYRLDPNSSGRTQLEVLPVPDEYRCNNDHDLSRDGKLLAFSASTPDVPRSRVFVAQADGTGIRPLTEQSPSYFHGWSPDGRWLAFVGQRNRKFELYRVSVDGGAEQRLTSAGAYDDGPEYSPDGKWIYFNSDRSGGWDIWRIPASGAGEGDRLAQRLSSDDGEDWFPHLSPDGKQILVLTFPPGTIGHNGRRDGMQLRWMKTPGSRVRAPKLRTLFEFRGGQGSINVNSWAPDGKRFAYVAYDLVP